MRFLVDAAFSPRLAGVLQAAGHDAVHVRDLGLQQAEDSTVMDQAATDGRVLLTADTDFGTLLARRASSRPSIVLFRLPQHRPERVAALLLANLPALDGPLAAGSLVVVEPDRLRVRRLPIGAAPAEDQPTPDDPGR